MTDILMAALPGISEETLAGPAPLLIPGDNPTVRDQMAFLTMHESYHLGQLGLLKKSMGGKGIMGG